MSFQAGAFQIGFQQSGDPVAIAATKRARGNKVRRRKRGVKA